MIEQDSIATYVFSSVRSDSPAGRLKTTDFSGFARGLKLAFGEWFEVDPERVELETRLDDLDDKGAADGMDYLELHASLHRKLDGTNLRYDHPRTFTMEHRTLPDGYTVQDFLDEFMRSLRKA